MKSEFLNPNSIPSYALMSTISGHVSFEILRSNLFKTKLELNVLKLTTFEFN